MLVLRQCAPRLGPFAAGSSRAMSGEPCAGATTAGSDLHRLAGHPARSVHRISGDAAPQAAGFVAALLEPLRTTELSQQKFVAVARPHRVILNLWQARLPGLRSLHRHCLSRTALSLEYARQSWSGPCHLFASTSSANRKVGMGGRESLPLGVRRV